MFEGQIRSSSPQLSQGRLVRGISLNISKKIGNRTFFFEHHRLTIAKKVEMIILFLFEPPSGPRSGPEARPEGPGLDERSESGGEFPKMTV